MPDHIYLLASRPHGTLYLGVTNDSARRVHEHRPGALLGFTREHGVTRLVWYEGHDRAHEAIAREKAIKRWRRDWKLRLVEDFNPGWTDLYPLLNR